MRLSILNNSLRQWEPFGNVLFNIKDTEDYIELLITNNENGFIYSISMDASIGSTETIEIFDSEGTSIYGPNLGSFLFELPNIIKPNDSARIKIKLSSDDDSVDTFYTPINFTYNRFMTDPTGLEVFLDFDSTVPSYMAGSYSYAYGGDQPDKMINQNSYLSVSNVNNRLSIDSMPLMSELSVFIKGYFTDILDRTLLETGNINIHFNNNGNLVVEVGAYIWTSTDFIRSSAVEYLIGISISDTGVLTCTLNGVVMVGTDEGVDTVAPANASSLFFFNNSSSNDACLGDYDYVTVYGVNVPLSHHGIKNEN